MVRAQRARKQQRPKITKQHDDDDPEAYRDMPVPDKKSSQYTKDKIDEFHDQKITQLLARGVQMDSDQEDLDEEDEVMALDDSESEDEEEEEEVEEEEEEEEGEEDENDMESDLEEKKDDDLPNDMAWGHRKKMFYDSDYQATKGKTQEELEAEDQEEEEEAKNIQQRLAADLSEEDYDLNLFKEFTEENKDEEKTVEKEERIVKDLKQMSQKEKMKLLKKESPELLKLIQDFKDKLAELKDELQPLVKMVKDGQIPPGKGADYLQTKQQLYLNYLTNISFYLVLKAKRIPAHNHPVIERLLTYRNLINELSEVDARLAPQLHKLLAGEHKEKAARTPGDKQAGVSSKKDKASAEAVPEPAEDSDSDLDEEAALRFYRGVEERLKQKRKSQSGDPLAEELEEYGDEEEEMDPDAKRAITYEMAKNKGLTPKRKKIDRNPRVKHREKFRRAKIRRKGQVREVRREEKKYSGEMSGIRAGIIKSVKLK